MSTHPSACGLIAMPTRRNTATSGTLIFWARKPVMVPMASISPQESNVCFAISIEADVSNGSPHTDKSTPCFHLWLARRHDAARRLPKWQDLTSPIFIVDQQLIGRMSHSGRSPRLYVQRQETAMRKALALL